MAVFGLDLTLTLGYAVAILLGLVGLVLGGRVVAILRRPPTGEAGREIVFLNGRELIPALALVGITVLVEWVEWLVGGLRSANVVALPSFGFYADVSQGILLFIAALLAYLVLTPYTRGQRQQHTRMILDRLAARVALLRGRR